MNEKKQQYLQPNLLRNRNLVASINTVWVADFTFIKTKIQNEPKSKIKLLMIYDLGNGEIVGAKVFKFNKTKTKIKEATQQFGISSIYVTNFFKKVLIKYNVQETDPPLIIHTDRGTEFLSKEYVSLKHIFPIQLSMSDAYQPTQNAVAERLNQTFKNQLKYIEPNIPSRTNTIKNLQSIMDQRVTHFNQKFKSERNLHLGAVLLREIFKNNDQPLPEMVMTYNDKNDKNKEVSWINTDANIIHDFRKKVKQNFLIKEEEVEFLENKFEKILREFKTEQKEIKDQTNRIEFNQHIKSLIDNRNYQKLMNYIVEIDQKVTKKQKKKHVTKPLREPIGKEIFQGLLEQHKGINKKRGSFYRFRLVTVLLYFTGMRLSEIGNLTEKQIRELQHKHKTQIFSSKQNKMIFVVVSNQIKPVLDKMETDILYTFYESFKAQQHEYLKQNTNRRNFVGWYNRQLKYYLKQYNETVKSKELEQNIQYLSSHSFRINRITQLLRHHMPIEKVQNIIGHANIATTEKYYRWKPNSQDLIQELTEIEQSQADQTKD
jgi:site-specific recombinase XerD/transposase InsO family protein